MPEEYEVALAFGELVASCRLVDAAEKKIWTCDFPGLTVGEIRGEINGAIEHLAAALKRWYALQPAVEPGDGEEVVV